MGTNTLLQTFARCRWRFGLVVLLLSAGGLLLPDTVISGQTVSIHEAVVAESMEDLLIYFRVEQAFSEEMEKGILNGMEATFTYTLTLDQIIDNWPDTEIISHTFDYTVKYDNLKEEFRIVRQQEPHRIIFVKSLAEAKRLMTEVNGLRVVPMARLAKGADYRLQVKAMLAKNTLPLNFHYLIPFWRYWDFETEWHVLHFRY